MKRTVHLKDIVSLLQLTYTIHFSVINFNEVSNSCMPECATYFVIVYRCLFNVKCCTYDYENVLLLLLYLCFVTRCHNTGIALMMCIHLYKKKASGPCCILGYCAKIDTVHIKGSK